MKAKSDLLARQSLLDGIDEFGLIVIAQIALDDIALFVDQERGRRELNIAERTRNVATCIVNDLEGKIARLGIGADVVERVIIHCDGNDLVPFWGVLLIRFDRVGHLLNAGNATCSPEFDQYDFTAQIFGAELLVLQRGKAHLRRAAGGGRQLPCKQPYQGNRDNNTNFQCFHWTGIV